MCYMLNADHPILITIFDSECMHMRGYIYMEMGIILKSNQKWISWAYNSLQIYTFDIFALVIVHKIECVNLYVHRVFYRKDLSLILCLFLLQWSFSKIDIDNIILGALILHFIQYLCRQTIYSIFYLLFIQQHGINVWLYKKFYSIECVALCMLIPKEFTTHFLPFDLSRNVYF